MFSKVTGIKAKLFLHDSLDCKSWVETRLIVPNTLREDDDNQIPDLTMRVRFSARALKFDGMEVKTPNCINKVPTSIRDWCLVRETFESKRLYILTLHTIPEQIPWIAHTSLLTGISEVHREQLSLSASQVLQASL